MTLALLLIALGILVFVGGICRPMDDTKVGSCDCGKHDERKMDDPIIHAESNVDAAPRDDSTAL